MMKKKLKCYVLTVSRYFPASHPRAGEETGFVKKIMFLDKKHTIRANYELWKKRVKEVNAGRAYVSIRYWEGKPYNSKQAEFRKLFKAGIQKVEMDNTAGMVTIKIDGKEYWEEERVATNDGLSPDDFLNWFFPSMKHEIELFSGAIIHFNPNFKY